MESSVPDSTTAAVWHIVWQLAPGCDLLADGDLAERVRLRLLDAHRQPGLALLHYVLAPSEIHLLSSLPPGTPPRLVARSVGNIVARWVRQAQGVVGVVFAGRYRAYAIDSSQSLRDQFRMLAWRPVVLGLCKVPTYHTSSSLRTLLGLHRPEGFDAMALLQMFGDAVPQARGALHRLIAKRPDAVEIRQWEFTRSLVPAPSNANSFWPAPLHMQGPAAGLVAACQPPTIHGALRLLERWVLLKLGVRDTPGRRLPPTTAARVRALVACVAVRLELCSAAAVARHFGRAKATLSERMAACRREPANRAVLGAPPARVVAEAIELAGLAELPGDVGDRSAHG